MAEQKRGWFWFALVLMAILVISYLQRRDFPGLHQSYLDSEIEIGRLRVQLESLRDQEQRLGKQVMNLDSDPLELEAAIRKGKNLVREGETIYRVILPQQSRAPGRPEAP